jgi:hypothetical protein
MTKSQIASLVVGALIILLELAWAIFLYIKVF